MNRIDPDGNLIIFINGMHFGDGGSSDYWEGMDKLAMRNLQDNNVMYIDGALGGGIKSLAKNTELSTRIFVGICKGYNLANEINSSLEHSETIKIITHSMGAAFAKGFISGLRYYGLRNNVNLVERIDFEVDFAPYQSEEQIAHSDIKTYAFHHAGDNIAGYMNMKNAKNIIPNQFKSILRAFFIPQILLSIMEHSIKDFENIFSDLNYNLKK